jgi:glycerophosphoryl diester phosphodiesterase
MVALLLILVTSASFAGSPARLLPAYAHNDYRNDRPLARALELGFRGVEVDYFVAAGELRVGHELDETTPGRTIESLYLAPLRERIRRHGGVYPGGGEFILNIESKREGMDTYEVLHEVLARYEDILTVVCGGEAEPGPVQVILVGWRPPLDYMMEQPVRYAAVQVHYHELPADHARYPSHLIKLISQNYNDKILSRGMEPVPPRMRRRLELLVGAAREVPGRLVRVYNVPTRRAAYEALLAAGVDLIGTKDIEGASCLLADPGLE